VTVKRFGGRGGSGGRYWSWKMEYKMLLEITMKELQEKNLVY